MTAYLWHVSGNLRHHLRAETVAEARERIAATHGDETARRAVIHALKTTRSQAAESICAAA